MPFAQARARAPLRPGASLATKTSDQPRYGRVTALPLAGLKLLLADPYHPVRTTLPPPSAAIPVPQSSPVLPTLPAQTGAPAEVSFQTKTSLPTEARLVVPNVTVPWN